MKRSTLNVYCMTYIVIRYETDLSWSFLTARAKREAVSVQDPQCPKGENKNLVRTQLSPAQRTERNFSSRKGRVSVEYTSSQEPVEREKHASILKREVELDSPDLEIIAIRCQRSSECTMVGSYTQEFQQQKTTHISLLKVRKPKVTDKR